MMHEIGFPYTPRRSQNDIVKHIKDVIERGGHAVLEAGTGTGKTICALVPTLEHALASKKKVLYLTRTNSQQTQVIMELRQLGIYGIGMQGRGHMCPLAREDEEIKGGSSEELSMFCAERKKRVLRGEHNKHPKKSCPYFYANSQMTDDKLVEIQKWARNTVPTIEEFCAEMGKYGLCPYELNKELAKDAVVLVAPYIYFFLGFIRQRLLEWMQVSIKDIILIIDEAHNLPDYGRELQSFEISQHSLGVVYSEAEHFGNPEVMEGVTITGFCDTFKDILENLSNEYVSDDDGFIPPNEMRVLLMSSLRITSHKLKAAIRNIVTYGEVIKDKKRKDGKLPRSYISGLGNFLGAWMNLDGEKHVKLVYGGTNPKIQAYCLDPSDGTKIINVVAGSVHMSGTLSPLEEYRDTIGLDARRTDMRTYPSPFPRDNRVVYYVEDATTRYEDVAKDKTLLPRIREYITEIAGLKRNTIVFFPSFRLLGHVSNKVILPDCELILDDKGLKQRELMERIKRFKELRGGMLFTVAGGRISEGMDFMGKQLEIAVIAGIPYPKPTAKQRALQNYYETKFGKGWEYTVKTPATRKMLQSIGRLIRSEADIGAAVILDKRAVHFKECIHDLCLSNDVLADLASFFEARSSPTEQT